jgi:hypothetical protein
MPAAHPVAMHELEPAADLAFAGHSVQAEEPEIDE